MAIEKPTTETQAAYDLGLASSDPIQIGAGVKGLVVPPNYTLKSLECYEAAPAAKRGTVVLSDQESFIQYVRAHAQPGTAIFAAPVDGAADGGQIMAVLDYHVSGPDFAAGWGRHIAILEHRLSPQWLAWQTMHQAASLAQVVFAEFLEERVKDVSQPASADVLEAARNFSVKRDVAFSSAVSLTSGAVRLTYNEDDKRGDIEFPSLLELSIPVHFGGPVLAFPVRWRYRLSSDGKLTFVVRITEIEQVLETASALRLARITNATGITPMRGRVKGFPQPVSL